MPRKPLPPAAPGKELNHAVVAAELTAADEVTLGEKMMLSYQDVLEKVGLMKGMYFSATVSERVLVETYVSIKETKSYKGLPYRDSSGKGATVATLEEFCEHFMPKSRRRCEELAANLHLLGAELYEQAESLGFRQRDYNALKALPADDQAIVKQAIEAGKLDNAIELMQDMAVKHAAEKESLQKNLQESNDNYEALGAQLRRKDQRINEQDAEITTLQRRISGAGFSSEEALQRLDGVTLEVIGKILSEFNGAISELLNTRSISDLSRAERQAIAASLGRVRLAVADVSEGFGIAPSEADDATQGVDETDEIWDKTLADLDAQKGPQHAGETH